MDRHPSLPAAPSPAPMGPAWPGVVVVDPDARMRAMVRALLVDHGFTVIAEVADGPGAVEAVRDLRPGVVVLAMHLPDRGTLRVASEIAALGTPTRVVLLTSSNPVAVHDEARAAGAFTVVVYGDATGLLDAVHQAVAVGAGA